MFGRMSVEENMMPGAYSRPGGGLADDFEHCFALFPRLRERGSQRAETLSGGEQQMLAIARGLMSRGPGSCSWTSLPSVSPRNS